jgi:D-glycero-alpha-D-manno-heptose-7-phosphate kinase
MALLMERIQPVTINLAVNLRTRVFLSPFKDGRVKVSAEGFPRAEEASIENIPFEPPFGLFFAALSYFGFHGLQVRIRSDSPVKSALGGSSTALVALIKALSKLGVSLGEKALSVGDILHLAYHLEDAVAHGKCGIQDQAAAVFGGVNLWTWQYGNRVSLFSRQSLLDRSGQNKMSNHILLAYSGKSHVSARINRGWLDDFLSGKTRAGWIEANEVVIHLGKAIREMKWSTAAGLLREEMIIRQKITPDALTPFTELLIHRAEEAGCGARFTGAGGGGCVWAVGELESIDHLKDVWNVTLATAKGAKLLDCRIDSKGVE